MHDEDTPGFGRLAEIFELFCKIVKCFQQFCISFVSCRPLLWDEECFEGGGDVGWSLVIYQLGWSPPVGVSVSQLTVSLGRPTKSVQPTYVTVCRL
jgi:hypothetical protein